MKAAGTFQSGALIGNLTIEWVKMSPGSLPLTSGQRIEKAVMSGDVFVRITRPGCAV